MPNCDLIETNQVAETDILMPELRFFLAWNTSPAAPGAAARR